MEKDVTCHMTISGSGKDHEELFAANRQECGCKAVCGDLREKDDNPRAVCKGLPVRMGVPNRG